MLPASQGKTLTLTGPHIGMPRRGKPTRHILAVGAAVAMVLACPPCRGATAEVYKVLEPGKSKHLIESAHFVARWNDNDAVTLSDEELGKGLATLEGIREFYLGKVGFPKPYGDQAVKYKISVNLSDKGWASGSGTGRNDPAMWLHFNAFKDKHALAHEFAHCLQFSTMGLRDSPFVGWSWESNAEWMTHQMYPDQVGCSDQLVNATHLYYGSTRNRYGNWQFWDQMYYTLYRFPWMVAIRGGHPYGNNPARHASTTGRKGAPHSNGGGWVDATAHVAASAYVGPAAMVLEQAQVTGKAKIGEQAVVSGNAKVSDNAIVRGHAVVSGNGIIGGNARIEEEASVYGGTVNEDARLGALTLVEDDQTKIHGQADIAAVMNNIRGVDLSGTVRLIGDIELNTSPLSKGVFYGMVTQEMGGNQRWGAERTAAAPEVTAAPARIWPN